MLYIDKIIKDNERICPIKPTYGDEAYYSISKAEIVIPERRTTVYQDSSHGCQESIPHDQSAYRRCSDQD